MKHKKGYGAGFFQGMNFSAKLTEAAFLSMLLKYKESKGYLKDGYETWTDFCRGTFGKSEDFIDKRLKAVTEFGPELTGIMIDLGMKWRDIRVIEQIFTEEQKAQLKKGVLEFNGKKIPVTEDHAPEVQSAFDLLIARADAAVKGEKLSKSKLDGIEKEHRKELKAYQEEVGSLKAQLPDFEDPEWAVSYMENVLELFNQFDLALRRFAFDKRVFEDPVIPAKIGGLIEQMRIRVREFNTDWNVACHEAWGEDV